MQSSKLKITFLGAPSYVQPIKGNIAKHFRLVDSLTEADLAVVASYGQILTKKELNTPKYGCINIHPSLLPKYRGPSPIQTAILNGDKVSGITIIKMDEEIDHGPILYQEQMELSDNDNFQTLSKKMFLKSAEVLPKIIKDFNTGKIKPVAQNHAISTFCDKLTRESGYFDINSPPSPEDINKMIRAYYPWPGVWTKWKGKIVKFLPPTGHPRFNRGSINNTNKMDSRLRGNDKYLLQMEGKKAISFKDFLNGYPDFPIKQLKF